SRPVLRIDKLGAYGDGVIALGYSSDHDGPRSELYAGGLWINLFALVLLDRAKRDDSQAGELVQMIYESLGYFVAHDIHIRIVAEIREREDRDRIHRFFSEQEARGRDPGDQQDAQSNRDTLLVPFQLGDEIFGARGGANRRSVPES